MSNKYKNKNNQTFLSILLIAILKAIWWIISLPFKKNKKQSKTGREERASILKKRLEIEELMKSENHIELKHALLEADKLVDSLFKIKGYDGDTFADRLRFAEMDLDRNLYDSIWQGHKIRNIIAHETELRISNSELRNATTKLLNYLKTCLC